MRQILISSFHPLISRNILSTPLIDLLVSGGARIILVVPEKKTGFFESEFGRPRAGLAPHGTGRSGVHVAGAPRELARRDRLLRYLALAAVRTRALDIKRRSDMGGSGRIVSRVIGNRPLLRRLIRWLDALLAPRGRFATLLDREKPDLVFATDIQNDNDVRLIHEARRRRIPIAGMVRSWDNLTAKGLIRALPDVLVVQNEIIRREAETLHGVPPERIRVVGIPHYDRYLSGPVRERGEFFRALNINPAKRLVVYAPVGDRYVGGKPVDRDIIAAVADMFPATHHLLVRLPPTDSVSFEGLENRSNVTIMRPGRQLARDPAMFRLNELSLEDDEMLRDTLAHCDVVVSGPSTFAVDAAVFDKPVILVAFDGRQSNLYDASVARYYDYEHFQPVLASGGVRLVRSAEELRHWLTRYFADPSLDRAGRKTIVKTQCGALDGLASRRLADVIFSAVPDPASKS